MSGTFPDIGDLPITYVDPRTLRENPANAAVHNERQIAAISESVRKYGWKIPFILNRRSGFILDGAGRLPVALQRKDRQVPVTYLDLDEREEREFLASWNRTAELSEWDDVKLASLFRLTMEDGAPPPSGWDAEEVGNLMLALAGASDEQNVPKPAKGSRPKRILRKEEERDTPLLNREPDLVTGLLTFTCPDCGCSFCP